MRRRIGLGKQHPLGRAGRLRRTPKVLRKLYDRTLVFAEHRHAIYWLAGISFIESSFFPIPPDVLLIPMVLAARSKWIRIALVCTAASVLGGLFGYLIGAVGFEQIGRPILDFYHATENSSAPAKLITNTVS